MPERGLSRRDSVTEGSVVPEQRWVPGSVGKMVVAQIGHPMVGVPCPQRFPGGPFPTP